MQQNSLTPQAFHFNATSQEIRSFLIEQDPWFVAKDICNILGLSNSRKAISSLDDDEKGVTKSDTPGGKQSLSIINESGLYALVLRSNKPEAKVFRKWITSEVLPAIRKKGYYSANLQKDDFIDARDIPYQLVETDGFRVRCIVIENENWFSINDVHRAIGATTDSGQAAKKLNIKQELAKKIWLFGNTAPAWFTTELGVNLILSGSRLVKSNQLKLSI